MKTINQRTFSYSAHDLRTPLNAIVGFTATLLMKLPGPLTADQECQLRFIQGSARELLTMVGTAADTTANVSEVVFPSESYDSNEQRTKSTPDRSYGATRVLYIDDDLSSRKLMSYVLESLGYESLTADSGEHGLAMARLELPDLILCDLQLSKTSGYEVALELKRDSLVCHIPRVVVTATPIDTLDIVAMGAFDYSLPKPICPETLAAKLASFQAGMQSGG